MEMHVVLASQVLVSHVIKLTISTEAGDVKVSHNHKPTGVL